jgi:hypothetical protein
VISAVAVAIAATTIRAIASSVVVRQRVRIAAASVAATPVVSVAEATMPAPAASTTVGRVVLPHLPHVVREATRTLHSVQDVKGARKEATGASRVGAKVRRELPRAVAIPVPARCSFHATRRSGPSSQPAETC